MVDLVAAVIGDGFLVILITDEEVIDGKGVGHGGGVDALVGGSSVVNEVGEVEGWIIVVWNAGCFSDGVGDGDAVADEVAVACGGEGGGKEIVTGEGVAIGAVIGHGEGGPVGFEIGVVGTGLGGIDVIADDGQRESGRDVVSGGYDVVFEADRSETIRVGDAGGDEDEVGGSGLFRGVVDLADVGGGVLGKSGVFGAWAGLGRGVFGGGADDFEIKTQVAATGLGVKKLNGDGVGTFV